MDKEKNFISAVVYVCNNEDTIKKFLEELVKLLKSNFMKYEIVCVNDYSQDDSVKVIKDIACKFPDAHITIINMSYYQGLELAMNAGVDLAIGDYVYEFDSVNIDYDIKIVMDVYKKSLEGYDIVNAVANNKKRLSSRLFYALFNHFSNSQYRIQTTTFRILSRRAINRTNSINKTIPYRKAIYANSGLKLATIGYDVKNGKNKKVMLKGRGKTAIDALVLFTDVSYKFTFMMSIITMIIVILVFAYTIFVFVSSSPIEGWTTIMLFLSFIFFTIFAILLIIIKYLSIIVSLIFKNSRYLIESIEKLN